MSKRSMSMVFAACGVAAVLSGCGEPAPEPTPASTGGDSPQSMLGRSMEMGRDAAEGIEQRGAEVEEELDRMREDAAGE